MSESYPRTRIASDRGGLFIGGWSEPGQVGVDAVLHNGIKAYQTLNLVDLLAALAKIPGVTATYEEPPELTVPERLNELGLGAVFALASYGYGFSTKYVKVGANKYSTDSGTTYGAHDFNSWANFELLSEGYKP